MPKKPDRPKRRQSPQEESIDQFQAYGEYSYAYQHQPQEEEVPGYAQDPGLEEIETLDDGPAGPMHAGRVPLDGEPAKRRKHAFLGRLLFLLVCAVAALVVLQGTVFRLKTVYVVGNKTKSPQEIAMLSGLVKGMNIFAINEQDVRANLSADHTVEFLSMQKDYPSTIYLYISERASTAVFQWLGMQYLLDPQGLVMEESNSLVLPEGILAVTGLQPTQIRVGQKLEVVNPGQLSAYVSILSELSLQLYGDQISELNLSDPDNLYLVTVDGITVRLGNGEYMRAKIGALRTDMAYLRQLGKTSGILDVSIPQDAKYMPEN
ncbi:MAG: FtsQ-type POTRA domain-containing protein [Candidatus Limiplasma sp.]|nr:FtsQ-type POTRA domain-containing protein [Candidatus Limiplasma sp.]